MGVTARFWNSKRVLLTGHTGFKGSWLSLWLQSLGADVVGYALAPDSPSLFEQARVSEKMASIYGHLEDVESLRSAFRTANPQIVVHMAAQSLVRRSYAEPVQTYATNVLGTVHVLELIRQTPSVRVAIIVTSDKCYENREWVWSYREVDRLGGHDPYSSSKACAELVTVAYRDSFFRKSARRPAVATVRAGNVIGGGDWAEDRLVPDCIRALIKKRPVAIRNPQAVRPWQHVLDPLCGYLMLLERLWEDASGWDEEWNFGSSHEECRPVSWLVSELTRRWSEQASWTVTTNPDQLQEATYLTLDSSKARRRLAWTPRLNLDTALDWVVEWYRAFEAGTDLQKITTEQISRYSTSLEKQPL